MHWPSREGHTGDEETRSFDDGKILGLNSVFCTWFLGITKGEGMTGHETGLVGTRSAHLSRLTASEWMLFFSDVPHKGHSRHTLTRPGIPAFWE